MGDFWATCLAALHINSIISGIVVMIIFHDTLYFFRDGGTKFLRARASSSSSSSSSWLLPQTEKWQFSSTHRHTTTEAARAPSFTYNTQKSVVVVVEPRRKEYYSGFFWSSYEIRRKQKIPLPTPTAVLVLLYCYTYSTILRICVSEVIKKPSSLLASSNFSPYLRPLIW